MLNAGERDNAWIVAHVPHQGPMCLLDRVIEWDEQHIVCEAVSHRDPRNPLRDAGRLGAAESVKRVHLRKAEEAIDWTADTVQGVEEIRALVEFKTTWHPIGS